MGLEALQISTCYKWLGCFLQNDPVNLVLKGPRGHPFHRENFRGDVLSVLGILLLHLLVLSPDMSKSWTWTGLFWHDSQEGFGNISFGRNEGLPYSCLPSFRVRRHLFIHSSSQISHIIHHRHPLLPSLPSFRASIHSFFHSFIHSIHSVMHSFIHPFIHSVCQWFLAAHSDGS